MWNWVPPKHRKKISAKLAASRFGKRKLPNAVIYLFAASGVLIAAFLAFNDEREKRLAAENQHPIILFRGPTIERVLVDPKYYNVEFRAETTTVHNAIPYLVSMCRIEDEKCNPAQSFNHKVQIGWHAGDDSWKERTIHQDDFVPFFISETRNRLYVFWKYQDNTFPWGENIPPGKYRVVLSVEGNESSHLESYILDWYGDVSTLHMVRSDK